MATKESFRTSTKTTAKTPTRNPHAPASTPTSVPHDAKSEVITIGCEMECVKEKGGK